MWHVAALLWEGKHHIDFWLTLIGKQGPVNLVVFRTLLVSTVGLTGSLVLAF